MGGGCGGWVVGGWVPSVEATILACNERTAEEPLDVGGLEFRGVDGVADEHLQQLVVKPGRGGGRDPCIITPSAQSPDDTVRMNGPSGDARVGYGTFGDKAGCVCGRPATLRLVMLSCSRMLYGLKLERVSTMMVQGDDARDIFTISLPSCTHHHTQACEHTADGQTRVTLAASTGSWLADSSVDFMSTGNTQPHQPGTPPRRACSSWPSAWPRYYLLASGSW